MRGVEGPWTRKWVIAAYGSWRDSEAREDFLEPAWTVEAGTGAEMRQLGRRIRPSFPFEWSMEGPFSHSLIHSSHNIYCMPTRDK